MSLPWWQPRWAELRCSPLPRPPAQCDTRGCTACSARHPTRAARRIGRLQNRVPGSSRARRDLGRGRPERGCAGPAGWAAGLVKAVGLGRAHVLLVAAGSLMATVAASFVGDPLGDASPAERYLSNTILLVGVVALLAWAWRQTRRAYPDVAAAACLQNERS